MEHNRRFYHINRQFLKAKALFFIEYAAVGCLYPYISLFMKSIGLSKSKAGIILGIIPFVTFFVQPLIGLVADKFQRHKTVIIVCSLGTALSFNALLFVPLSSTKFSWVQLDMTCNHTYSSFHIHNTSIQGYNECPMMFDSYDASVQKLINGSKNNEMYDPHKCKGNCFHKKSEFDNCVSNKFFENTPSCKANQVTLSYDKDEKRKLLNTSSDGQPNTLPWSVSFPENTTYSSETILKCSLQCTTINACEDVTYSEPGLSSLCMVVIFILLGYATNTPVKSMLDAITYDILGESDSHKYGQQRLWANVSLALFAVLSGYLIDIIDTSQSVNKFRLAFYGFALFELVLITLTFVCSFNNLTMNKGGLKGLVQLLKTPPIIIFLSIMLFLGFLNGSIEAFLYWFLEEDLQNEYKIIPGLCMLSNCISEIIMFYFSGKIIKRLGRLNVIYIALFAFALRFGCYSVLPNAWYVLPVELLNGITFSLLWSAATSHANILTPDGLSSTIQGVVSGVFTGLGKGLGGLITGQLYTFLEIRWIFRVYSLSALLVLALYLTVNKTVFRHTLQKDDTQGIEKANNNNTNYLEGTEEGLLPKNGGVS